MTHTMDFDGLDIGYCSRCGADMAGQPPAAVICGDCAADDGQD